MSAANCSGGLQKGVAHDTESFENDRWGRFAQPLEFRHAAAVQLITAGPVLDIGCGDGLLLSLLSEKDLDVEGIDISPEAVRLCTAKGLAARTYDPASPLPFADASFSTVVLLDVLEHVYDPAALLAEAARVTKDAVIVGVPNFSSLPSRVQVAFGKVPENNLPNKGHVYWFNRQVLSAIAHTAGLQEQRIRMNTFRPFTAFQQLVSLAPNLLSLSFVVRYAKSGIDSAHAA